MASGRISVDEGRAAVDNVTLVFREYLDNANIMGKELLEFGLRRVGRAEFHGEAINVGRREAFEASSPVLSENIPGHHRADVLIWILATAAGHVGLGGQVAAPKVVELGVFYASTSRRLLTHGPPELQWVGVDPFGREHLGPQPGCAADSTANGSDAWCDSGAHTLLAARAALRPWLESRDRPRARLMVAPSLDASALLGWVGGAGFLDLVFVDGDHSEKAARADLAAWGPHVRPGGVVAGHDYAWVYPGVVRAAHGALPEGATLHLAPDRVFWWRVPWNESERARNVF